MVFSRKIRRRCALKPGWEKEGRRQTLLAIPKSVSLRWTTGDRELYDPKSSQGSCVGTEIGDGIHQEHLARLGCDFICQSFQQNDLLTKPENPNGQKRRVGAVRMRAIEVYR